MPSSSRSRVIASFAGIALLLFLGIGGFSALASLRQPPERRATVVRGYPVDTMFIERTDHQEMLEAFGTARALQNARLKMRISGTVAYKRPGLLPGVRVSAGEELVRLDLRTFQAGVDSARASLHQNQGELERLRVSLAGWQEKLAIAERDFQLAKDNFERSQELNERGVISQREYDQAELSYKASERVLVDTRQTASEAQARIVSQEAGVRASQAALDRAETDLSDATLRAPFDGVVSSVNIELGETVSGAGPGSSDAMVSVVATDRIEIPLTLGASRLGEFAVGDPVKLSQPANPDRVWEGQLARISPTVDASDRTVEVFVEVENTPDDEAPLLPGTFLVAELQGRLFRDAVVIPRRAMIDGRVYVVEQRPAVDEEGIERTPHIAREKSPHVRLAAGAVVVIDRGLEVGEELVLTNLDVLYDEAPLRLTRLIEAEKAAAAANGAVATDTE